MQVDPLSLRDAPAAGLVSALQATRQRTLGLLSAWQQARPDLRVPQRPTLNPPLWELGHVGWFQEWWMGRNTERGRGHRANPDTARPASHLPEADACSTPA
jgi:iron(II)-dependent oxidoreductase